MTAISMPARPKRRPPSLRAVAAFHGVNPYRCVRCGIVARTERAHVVDRWLGGLDGPQNIRPLCHACHVEQPVFCGHELARALLWFSTPNVWVYVTQLLRPHAVEIEHLASAGGLETAEAAIEFVRVHPQLVGCDCWAEP